MEPDRQLREIVVSDQEHGGIQEAKPPSAWRRGGADFNFFGHRL